MRPGGFSPRSEDAYRDQPFGESAASMRPGGFSPRSALRDLRRAALLA